MKIGNIRVICENSCVSVCSYSECAVISSRALSVRASLVLMISVLAVQVHTPWHTHAKERASLLHRSEQVHSSFAFMSVGFY